MAEKETDEQNRYAEYLKDWEGFGEYVKKVGVKRLRCNKCPIKKWGYLTYVKFHCMFCGSLRPKQVK